MREKERERVYHCFQLYINSPTSMPSLAPHQSRALFPTLLCTLGLNIIVNSASLLWLFFFWKNSETLIRVSLLSLFSFALLQWHGCDLHAKLEWRNWEIKGKRVVTEESEHRWLFSCMKAAMLEAICAHPLSVTPFSYFSPFNYSSL